MNLWIVLFSFLFPIHPTEPTRQGIDAPTEAQSAQLRYRGIERLLAKFDAEADAEERGVR
jgi:hypothetical protein